MPSSRKSEIKRKTNETDIVLSLDLDNTIAGGISSGSGFLDHMLDLFQKHSGIGLSITCKGDTEIDMHHSCEDIAICLGSALAEALGDKKGIERFGFSYVPMDESLARVVIDLSGRSSFIFTGKINNSIIGNFDTELVPHFFESFSQAGKFNLHIDILRGQNAHHCIEAVFKAFAKALSAAVSISGRVKGVPSTKGTL